MNLSKCVRRVIALLAVALVTVTAPVTGQDSAAAVGLPAAFIRRTITTDLLNPVAMEIGPDGRIYVAVGAGVDNPRQIIVIDDDAVLPDPYVVLPDVKNLEAGLNGFTWHPEFPATPWFYVSYLTDVGGPQRFEIARYEVAGGVVDPDSKTVIFGFEDENPEEQFHQGGDIAFGPDNLLYWVTGDRVLRWPAQRLTSMVGKVLRLNDDGTIPPSNPHYDSREGKYRAIYARGLRNPWRIERQPGTGDLFISEVGNFDLEEINLVSEDANYGWPRTEGLSTDPRDTSPVYTYQHFEVPGVYDPATMLGCAVTGTAFYPSGQLGFPPGLAGKLLLGDHCMGWIDAVDIESGVATRFMTGADRLIDIVIDPYTGDIYYLDREYEGDDDRRSGGVGRIEFNPDAPLTILQAPVDRSAAIGEEVEFVVDAVGQAPLSYQWRRNGVDLPGEVGPRLAFTAPASDDGAPFSVVVTDGRGQQTTAGPAVLTVGPNRAPVPVIEIPAGEDPWVAGDTIEFAGSAVDAEDGSISPTSFEWEVVFHHDAHTHPFLDGIDGVAGGEFDIPTSGETAPNIWYRIHLTVTDSDGAVARTSRDVFPVRSQITIDSYPIGGEVTLDGATITTPYSFEGVAGIVRYVSIAEEQSFGGSTGIFTRWSNRLPRAHGFSTPAIDSRVTAFHAVAGDRAPQVSIVSPDTGRAVDAPLIVTGGVIDDSAIADVRVYVKRVGIPEWWNGSTWTRVASPIRPPVLPELDLGGTALWTAPTGLEESGRYLITAEAVDAANLVASTSRTIELDGDDVDDPPSISIIQPAVGEVVEGAFNIRGFATDDRGVADIKVFVKRTGVREWWNGSAFVDAPVALRPDEPSTPGNWRVVTGLTDVGEYRITAEIVDSAGLSTSATQVNEIPTPEDESPTIMVTSPVPATTVSAPLTIVGIAGDDIGVVDITVQIKKTGAREWWNGTGFGLAPTNLRPETVGAGVWTLNSGLDVPGSYQISSRVTDSIGQFHVNRQTNIVEAAIDEPPMIEITNPTGNTSTDAPLIITGTADDDRDLTDIRVTIKRPGERLWWNGTDWTPTITPFRPTTIAPGTWTITTGLTQPGPVTITAQAIDTADQRTTITQTNIVEAAIDEPPMIEITNPTGNTSTDAPLIITGTADDDRDLTDIRVTIKRPGERLWWNGTDWTPTITPFRPTTIAPGTWTITTGLTQPGPVTITAQAIDTADQRTTITQTNIVG